MVGELPGLEASVLHFKASSDDGLDRHSPSIDAVFVASLHRKDWVGVSEPDASDSEDKIPQDAVLLLQGCSEVGVLRREFAEDIEVGGESEFEDALKEIALLDEAFERGEIPEEGYFDQRARLIRQIKAGLQSESAD